MAFRFLLLWIPRSDQQRQVIVCSLFHPFLSDPRLWSWWLHSLCCLSLMFAYLVLSSTMRMTVARVIFNSSGNTGVETKRKKSRHRDGRYTLEPSPSIFAAIWPAIVLANCPSHLAFSRLLRYASASWSDIFQHRRRLYFHHLAYFAPLDPSNRMALPMLALPPFSLSSVGPELAEASRKRLQPTCW